MSKRAQYELGEAAYEWVNRYGISGAERQTLMEDIRKEIRESSNIKRLLVEAADAAMKQELGPVDCIAIGVNYGAALVLAHAIAQQRAKRVV